jgi:hypothetical protein
MHFPVSLFGTLMIPLSALAQSEERFGDRIELRPK